jgi:succinyl-CoA synthetase alpha subunit
MSWTAQSQVLIQGVSEPLGAYYSLQMRQYGTKIQAGVAAGEGGQSLGEIPLYDLVAQAVTAFPEITTSLIFVPPYQVRDAALEAMAAGIRQLIIVTPRVPPRDMIHLLDKAQMTNTLILGSGSQGLLIPEQLWLGILEPQCYSRGSIGLVSRSDRLLDDVALSLTQAGLGQSQVISLGSDSLVGTNFEPWLQVLEEDEQTEAIILVGHPAYTNQLLALEYIISAIEKPVVVYIPGCQAPIERSLGTATSIITNYLSSSLVTTPLDEQILQQLTTTHIQVATSLSTLPLLVKNSLLAARELSAQKI